MGWRSHKLKPTLTETPDRQPLPLDSDARLALLDHIARLLAEEYVALYRSNSNGGAPKKREEPK